MRCRTESMYAAKKYIIQETDCREMEALVSYKNNMKLYGYPTHALEAAVAEIQENQNDITGVPNPLDVQKELTGNSPKPSQNPQHHADLPNKGALCSNNTLKQPAVDPHQRVDVDLLWKAKYDSLRIELERSESQKRSEVTTEVERLAKATAVTSICATTGKPIREVEPLLTKQMARFRDFAEAVRMTTELLNPHASPASDTQQYCDRTPTRPQSESRTEELSSILPNSGPSAPPRMDPSPPTAISSFHQHAEKINLFSPPKVLPSKQSNPRSLRDCYNSTLSEGSLNTGENSMKYSVQIDRPLVWVDVTVDPKYPCAGWSVEAYTAWKENAEKRKSQGANQRFVLSINLNMLDTICTMLRIAPDLLLGLSDEDLTQKLDAKFNIAQETNLLLIKFSMPQRPNTLKTWELHLPTQAWGAYVTKWLKELRKQEEGGKDLEKYDLTDVFIQSIQEFKLLHDHARNLKKLPVKELIANCTDYLQEQTISEQKSKDARTQVGMTASSTETKKDDSSENPNKKEKEWKAFAPTTGPMTVKQARAFMTEAAKLASHPHQAIGVGAPKQAKLPPFVQTFNKLSFFDVNCEGCGKWYKNQPGNRYPYPCHGKCQYEGHPSQNKQFQAGTKWKYPGFCCTWKGMEDKDIPPEVLSRLQNYSRAPKRDRNQQS
jgi:hypothetical protein